MTTSRTTTAAGLVVSCALLSLLTGCASGSAESTTTPATTAPVGTPTTDTPREDAETDDAATDDPTTTPTPRPQVVRHRGEWDLVFHDVRVGRHPGHDRIVLDLEGSGSTPGWSVEYVDRARLEGSGERVPMAGDSVLQVVASGTTWPGEGYYDGPSRVPVEDGGRVREVYVGGTFEGYTQVFVGLDGEPAPFEVFALSDPARLVVDVRGGRPAS